MKTNQVSEVAKAFSIAIEKALKNLSPEEIRQIDWFTYNRK